MPWPAALKHKAGCSAASPPRRCCLRRCCCRCCCEVPSFCSGHWAFLPFSKCAPSADWRCFQASQWDLHLVGAGLASASLPVFPVSLVSVVAVPPAPAPASPRAAPAALPLELAPVSIAPIRCGSRHRRHADYRLQRFHQLTAGDEPGQSSASCRGHESS